MQASSFWLTIHDRQKVFNVVPRRHEKKNWFCCGTDPRPCLPVGSGGRPGPQDVINQTRPDSTWIYTKMMVMMPGTSFPRLSSSFSALTPWLSYVMHLQHDQRKCICTVCVDLSWKICSLFFFVMVNYSLSPSFLPHSLSVSLSLLFYSLITGFMRV